jgi:hypothetical protein
MCPLCIGSALLVLTGAGSAGGLALIVARATSTVPRTPDPAEPNGAAEKRTPADGARARNARL